MSSFLFSLLKLFFDVEFYRKYEEIYPPEIGEFVYITDDTYTKQQVLRMEKLLLKVLSFDLCAPSTLTFINLFSSMMNIPEKVQHMAKVSEVVDREGG